ncbi:hypothetical protein [Pseudomonas sp. NPDC089569]|uniref:hypothetical protein n=1 Tax=Pseudomonas sp. NPDC089569 TaxID=3390722 RepID=UPI003D06FE56
MINKPAEPNLDRILMSAKYRYSVTGETANLVQDLESVVAACWGQMTSLQREQLMSCAAVASLLNPVQAAQPTPVALPHYHHIVTYSSDADEENMFQSMLVLWYQVADILRQMPAGTIAKYQGGNLFVGALDGELYMFDSPDLDGASQTFNMFRPDDFNGIGESDLQDIRDQLAVWLQNPTYDDSVSPDSISEAIIHNYGDSHSEQHWAWDGVVGR